MCQVSGIDMETLLENLLPGHVPIMRKKNISQEFHESTYTKYLLPDPKPSDGKCRA
jgi:hypothetical protein